VARPGPRFAPLLIAPSAARPDQVDTTTHMPTCRFGPNQEAQATLWKDPAIGNNSMTCRILRRLIWGQLRGNYCAGPGTMISTSATCLRDSLVEFFASRFDFLIGIALTAGPPMVGSRREGPDSNEASPVVDPALYRSADTVRYRRRS
jgi:hypothetical protein